MFSNSFSITLSNIRIHFLGIHFPGIHFPRNSLSKRKPLSSKQTRLRNEDFSEALSDEEIVDNAITIMIAGHDTISILLATLIRLLANDQHVYAGIVQGMKLN